MRTGRGGAAAYFIRTNGRRPFVLFLKSLNLCRLKQAFVPRYQPQYTLTGNKERKQRRMSKSAIFGQIVSLVGAALWIFGYFATGHRSLINWQAYTPSWVAEFLPNLESEVGMVLCLGGMIVMYWPRFAGSAETGGEGG
jgi:hypothetical protein